MITAELLAPVITTITSNITTIIPAGLGILALMIGVELVPRLIRKFL